MKMDETDFQAIVSGELEDAAAYVDEEISPRRALLTQLYQGQVPGLEAEEGRSQMVSRDVRDTVHATLPSLMRVFTGAERVVEYTPTGPEDVEVAEQATDYANYIFLSENDGFSVLHTAFKDALTRKTGFAKAWWDESEESKTQRYTGLDEATVMALQAEADAFELLGQSVDEMGVARFDVRVTKVVKKGRIRVEAVPPEEIIVARRDKVMGETLVAHRRMMTVSDLVAMGYEQEEIEEHIQDDDINSIELRERRNLSAERTGSAVNEALRRVLYCEAYIRVDRDGDGIAERLRVCTVGSGYEVLDVEEVDHQPIVAFTVDPEPHVSPLEAVSKADDVADVQRLKTVLLRNSLDALAQSINPRTVVVEGRVEIQDVLNNEVGAVIRAKSPDSVIPLVTPDTSSQGLQMLAYADEIKEARTGLSKAAQGLDPDALRSTAKNAANAVVSATQSQIEMTARMLSHGMRDLFRLLLKLMTVHQDQPKVVRLRNKWVQVDPRTWSPSMDVTVTVALGTGTNQEKFNILAGIAQKQEMVLQTMGPTNPMVSLSQYSYTLSKMIELAGFKDAAQFVTRLPANFQLPPAPPAPDAQAQAAQMLAQVEREKAQAKMQVEREKLQAEIAIEQQKMALEREQMQAEFARKELELRIKAAQVEGDLSIKQAKAFAL